MSRVHEPTIGDYTRAMLGELRNLAATVDLQTDAVTVDEIVRAFQQRRAELLEDLAAIRRRESDLTAQMVKVRAATLAELEVCERALDRAGAPYEVDDE